MKMFRFPFALKMSAKLNANNMYKLWNSFSYGSGRFIGLDILFNIFLHSDELIQIIKAFATSSATTNEYSDATKNVNINHLVM